MRREQKTEESGWTCKGTVEPESNKGARSIATPETGERNGADALRGTALKPLNRRVPNGTHGGVRGRVVK